MHFLEKVFGDDVVFMTYEYARSEPGHADGNPYRRYASHPDLVMVTATAGSALLLHPRVFHGTYPNVGSRSREMVQVGYRPAWAGPVKEEVPEWEPHDHAKLPESVKPLFADRNTRKASFEQENKPADMASAAPGISPHRWKLDQEFND